MAAILAIMFVGITYLSFAAKIVPTEQETVISLLARSVFGTGPMYFIVQAATALILLLAANTSFADFPRLSSFLSKDRFLPRAMASKGDRLVFQNGIILLAVLSCILIVVFHGSTHQLMPLYAVGVFVSFTLSQSGMVKHWIDRKQGHKALVNGIGAFTTAVVAVILMITKFSHGAWIVMLVIPLEVLGLLRINKHYEKVRMELKVGNHKPISRTSTKHLVVVPIEALIERLKAALEP
jgi:amino acid transporter